jgi:UDP-N-acetylglucosamine 2-epimerase (non-hydrolysing)
MRVLVVIGTRPEAIKLAPLVHELQAAPDVAVTTCITSQHRELLRPLLSFFQIPSDHDLAVMTTAQSLADVTARILQGVAGILARDAHDVVVVQGDTATALAAGLAAFYGRVPLAHVEAGLRSHDLERPFPEEANRRLIDTVSRFLFAPTAAAQHNLLAEGFPAERVFVTGNTGIDALHLVKDRIQSEYSHADHEITTGGAGRGKGRMALVTAHRRESFGEGLHHIFQAIVALTERFPDLRVIVPVHPNPNVVAAARRCLAGRQRISLTSPLDYPQFVRTLLAADLVLTDSGGVQEEAVALGKPVLVLRETTERTEGIDMGAAALVGTDVDKIVTQASAILTGTKHLPKANINPYGDGQASRRIVRILKTGRLAQPFNAAMPKLRLAA